MKGLRALRIAQRLTFKKLSAVINISIQALYYYEVGKRFPKREVLERLTKYFNCTIDKLM